MLSEDFLRDFKCRTEEYWRQITVDLTLYGFQFQPGTRWNPGLSENEVGLYEAGLGVALPEDLKKVLRAMNGTYLPTLNVYGYSSGPVRQSAGVFSFPTDLGEVRRRAEDVEAHREQLVSTLAEQSVHLAREDSLVPTYIHRYVV